MSLGMYHRISDNINIAHKITPLMRLKNSNLSEDRLTLLKLLITDTRPGFKVFQDLGSRFFYFLGGPHFRFR